VIKKEISVPQSILDICLRMKGMVLFSGTGDSSDSKTLQGFAYQLNTVLTNATGIDGLITNRKSSLQSDIRRLQAKADQEQLRLDDLQQMYKKSLKFRKSR
jgi:flagellar capping protein FliD